MNSGFGDGGGFGFGYGYGYGYGFGHGYGFGDGYGDGYGGDDGFGDDGLGVIIGKVGAYDVRYIARYRTVAVGCHAHSVDYWRNHWKDIAEAEEVDVPDEVAAEFFKRIEKE